MNVISDKLFAGFSPKLQLIVAVGDKDEKILLTRPDSSKTLALYKSCTYLLTYLLT